MSEITYTGKEKFIVFFACALGWAHDAIGLTLINFLALPIANEFTVTLDFIGLIMSAQYIATVPGAFLFGYLADRFGRKNFLLVSVIWDALLTAASAFAPNILVFAILRVVSGMGVSWGIAFALLGEVYSPKRRAMFGGWVHATFILGYVGSGLSALLLESPLKAMLGSVVWWRPLFLIALFPIPLVLILYFILPESRLWQKYSQLEAAESMTLREQLGKLVHSGYLKILLLCTFLFWAAEFAYHATVDWGPTFLQTAPMPYTSGQADLIVMLIAIVLIFIFPTVGFLGDKIGRRKAFMLPASLGLIGVTIFGVFAVLSFDATFALFGLLIMAMGFSSHGLFGVWSSELFPTSSRAAANSVIFSVARGVSLGAWVVSLLAVYMGFSLAQAMLISVIGFVLMFILPWTLPETKGKVLEPV